MVNSEAYFDKAEFVDVLWSDVLENQISFLTYIKKFYFANRKISFIDAACGTGRLTFPLFNKIDAIHAIGFDSSKDMISFAKKKNINKKIDFFIGDLSNFISPLKSDFLFCMYTSFNYLNTESKILNSLLSFNKSLNLGGVAVIDLSNLFDFAFMQNGTSRVLKYKNSNFFVTQIIDVEYNTKSSIWNHFETLFIERKDKSIKKIIEHHKLKYITPNEMKMFCEKSGFLLEKTYFGYSLNSDKNEHRLIFIIKKIK